MNRHPAIRLLSLAAAIGLLCSAQATASTYVYEGRLDDGGRPADGRYDLSLTPYPAEKQGATLAAPMVFEDVEVRGGQFRLEFDLPAMNAEHTWLELGVRDGAAAGDFAAIPGRAKAIAAPLVGACWSTTGDTGVNPATNFLGTTDNQPLAFRVNNTRAWQASFVSAGINGTSVNVVAGDDDNSASSTFTGQTVAGGGNAELPNRAQENYTTVSGGRGNVATRVNATVSGGERNTASGEHSVVVGGLANSATAPWSAVGGGDNNCAGGLFSWAGGRFAKVRPGTVSGAPGLGCNGVPLSGDGDGDNGTFVWSDSQNGAFQSTGPNQFLVRAAGGMALNGPPIVPTVEMTILGADSFANLFLRQGTPNATTGGYLLSVGGAAEGQVNPRLIVQAFNGSTTTGERFVIDNNGGVALNRGDATINPFNDPGALVVGTNATNGNRAFLSTGGTWTNASSRTLKEAFEAVDVGAVLSKVLQLPITSWRYTGSAEGRHLGPMSEDFHAAFGLGASERSIATVDTAGVALAAIQGLNEKLEAENATLRARLSAIEAKLGLD